MHLFEPEDVVDLKQADPQVASDGEDGRGWEERGRLADPRLASAEGLLMLQSEADARQVQQLLGTAQSPTVESFRFCSWHKRVHHIRLFQVLPLLPSPPLLHRTYPQLYH